MSINVNPFYRILHTPEDWSREFAKRIDIQFMKFQTPRFKSIQKMMVSIKSDGKRHRIIRKKKN